MWHRDFIFESASSLVLKFGVVHGATWVRFLLGALYVFSSCVWSSHTRLTPRRRYATYAQQKNALLEAPARTTWLKIFLLMSHGNNFDGFGRSQSSHPCPLMSCLYYPLQLTYQYYNNPLLQRIHCLAVCGLCCDWVAVLYLRVIKYYSTHTPAKKMALTLRLRTLGHYFDGQ